MDTTLYSFLLSVNIRVYYLGVFTIVSYSNICVDSFRAVFSTGLQDRNHIIKDFHLYLFYSNKCFLASYNI